MKKYFSKRRTQTLLSNRRGPLKLNVGCGTDYKRGWINIDNNTDNNIEKVDLDWDMRNPLPFDDGSVDFIFHEHFLEHLTVEEAQSVIKDLMRVLKPNGVMRIAMPDLEDVVNTYVNVPLDKDPIIKRRKLNYIKTRAEWINMSFRWWDHMWLYDYEELKRRLADAGCTKVKRVKKGKSKYKQLQNLETREESLLVAEVTK